MKFVDFITRKEWKAKLPRRPFFEKQIPQRITVHHFIGFDEDISAKQMYGFDGIETMLALQKHDMKVLQLNDIAYHLIIDREGKVWEGRDFDCVGNHVKSNNTNNIGILLYGNFQIEEPTNGMIIAFKRSLIEIKVLFPNLDIPKCIFSHREFTFTECPGEHLYDIINNIKWGTNSIYDGVDEQ